MNVSSILRLNIYFSLLLFYIYAFSLYFPSAYFFFAFYMYLYFDLLSIYRTCIFCYIMSRGNSAALLLTRVRTGISARAPPSRICRHHPPPHFFYPISSSSIACSHLASFERFILFISRYQAAHLHERHLLSARLLPAARSIL